MSRSQPSSNNPNPCTRWFEWDGSNGAVRYYDKDKKENVEVGKDFTFILLDELSTVTGYNDRKRCSMHANEIRDTRTDVLLVKWHDGSGVVAEGLYADIKDKVFDANGGFTTNLYLAFKNEKGELVLGSLKLKGAALSQWMDFKKANRAALYKGAVQIKGSLSKKKGKVDYEIPVFGTRDISDETNSIATAIDVELQEFLKGYFKRTVSDRASNGYAAEDENQEAPGDRNDHSEKPEHARRNDPELDVEGDETPW